MTLFEDLPALQMSGSVVDKQVNTPTPPVPTQPTAQSGTHLPGVVCARRVSLVQPGGAVKVKAHNEGRDAKRPAPVALRVALVGKGHVTVPSQHNGPQRPLDTPLTDGVGGAQASCRLL